MKWGKENAGKFPDIVRQSWQTVENIREELEKTEKSEK
jgi:ribonuclease HII